MRKELDYFYVGSDYGGNQETLTDLVMKMGGCAAITACDICVYLSKYCGEKLCDFDANDFSKSDYVSLTRKMKPFLHPRFSGINKTKIYVEGFANYVERKNSKITLSSLEGTESLHKAKSLVTDQIDRGIPIPMLVLYHKNPRFKDYTWHWFIINGYEEFEGEMMVKVVSYGEWQWFDFKELWDSGYSSKGGLIKIEL